MMETMSRSFSPKRGLTWSRQPGTTGHLNGKVCKFWLAGHCARNPCRFLHPDEVVPSRSVMPLNGLKSKQSRDFQRQQRATSNGITDKKIHLKRIQQSTPHAVSLLKPLTNIKKRGNDVQNYQNRRQRTSPGSAVGEPSPLVTPEEGGLNFKQNIPESKHNSSLDNAVRRCTSFRQNEDKLSKPSQPERQNIHEREHNTNPEDTISRCTPSNEDKISKLAQLEGHTKAVTGITLPSGSDKLFTGSKDGTVRVWNCHTGECTVAADMGSEVGCLISEGPWVFAGLTNAIKAWNTQTTAELTLSAPTGLVHALETGNEMLFAGVQDGSIYVWKYNSEAASFEAAALLKGHTNSVVSLFFGANRLYSGSMDNTIRVWDTDKMLCIHTLRKHSEVVMSVLCWEQFLLSCSLDKSIKVWAATEAGELDVTYARDEDHGSHSLCGMHDAAGKSILVSACNDKSVRLYELPSFAERGRILSREEVRVIHVGPQQLIFTGYASGLISVWRCTGDLATSPDKAV